MQKETKIRLLTGLGVFLTAFIIYVKTMAATTSFWDCGEFIAISNILGIPHPPGYPLYAVIGRTVILMLPFIKEIAVRINVLSPLFSAITVAFVYLLTVKLIVLWRGEPQDDLERLMLHLSGAVAAIFLAFAPTWWDNSIEAEVYGMAMFTMTLTVWLAMRWRDNMGQVGNRKVILLLAFLFGLGWASHMATLLAALPIFIFILLVDWKAMMDWKIWLIGGVLFFLALTINAYLLVRSNLNPAINECAPKDWDSMMYVLQRKQYEPFNFFERKADFMYQFNHMFFRYFKWQFNVVSMALGIFGALMHLWEGEDKKLSTAALVLLVGGILLGVFQGSPMAAILIALAIVFGFFHLLKRKDKSFSLVGPAFLITGLGLVVYLNMGNPQPRDRDYIYAPCYLFYAIWIGMGTWRLMKLVREVMERYAQKWTRYAIVGLGVILLGVGLFNVKRYYLEKDRSKNWIASDYGYNILESALPGGIIFTNGDNDTFPVWFVQEVWGVRKDVRIVNLSLGNTNWYLKQMKQNGVAMDISDYQIDQLQPLRTPDGQIFKISDIAVRLIIAANAGKKLTFAQVLAPPKEFAALVFGKGYRENYPIYFAATVSDDNLTGLENYLSFEGMLYRILPDSTSKKQPNIEVTQHNLTKVYKMRGLTDPKVFKDENTQRLLGNYAVTYWNLGMALRRQADRARLEKQPDLAKDLQMQAVQQFEQAHQIMPEEAAGLNWLGVTYAELGEFSKSLVYFRQVMQKDPANPYVLMQLGMSFQQAGIPDSAEYYYRRGIQVNPNFGEGYGRLYTFYVMQKETAKAIAVLEEWLARNPSDGNAREELNKLKKTR
jgi:tetratricopeptide (TPR) repeat protein